MDQGHGLPSCSGKVNREERSGQNAAARHKASMHDGKAKAVDLIKCIADESRMHLTVVVELVLIVERVLEGQGLVVRRLKGSQGGYW